MKRGQTQQIFVWLVVLVVAVSILFFGIKLIKKAEGLKDEVLIIDFFNDLDKKLSQYYYLDKGSSGEERFLLPNDVKKVCFTNPDTLRDNPRDREVHYFFQLKDFSNVFIMPNALYENNRFKLETKFKINSNPFCKTAVGGSLSLELENLGVSDGVKIK